MKKTIAILGARGIPGNYGGFETFAEELAVRLVTRGYEVTVFCEKNAEMPSSYKGVNLKYVMAPNLGPLKTIIYDVVSIFKARKEYDIVYMLGYGASFSCFIPRIYGNEVWINMDGIEWKRSKWNKLAQLWFMAMERIAITTASKIVADAQSILTHLEARYRRLPNSSVIAYGAPALKEKPNEKLLSEWGLEKEKYYILVGRMEPENHILEILEGFKKSNTKMKLVVLGNHKAKNSYVEKLLAIRDERIHLIGTVFDSDKLEALRYFSIAYFHGHSVGGTNPSLLEALGCSNPVIAHDNVFNREVARDAAVYFENNESIPQLINDIENDTGKREMMGAAGLNIISNYYTWDIIVDKYVELMEVHEPYVERHSGINTSKS